jgi:hypothetical protein
MLRKVISGGQTGVDQAGLVAARALGLETGGWAPRGWMTEDGPAPWLADYGLVECPEPGYPARTRRNAADAEGTLWLGDPASPGGLCTLKGCRLAGMPWCVVHDPKSPPPAEVADWLVRQGIAVVNVAGHRESSRPGIGVRAERYLRRVFEAALQLGAGNLASEGESR